MEYKYVVIYRFEGISDNNLDEDIILYQDYSASISVILTKDVNRHCLILDKGLACAGLVLSGMLGDERIHELPIELDTQLKKIQEERASKNNFGAYVVIIIKGQAELHIKEDFHKETEQFRICFDALDKESIREKHKESINSIVSSLSICTGADYRAERISS